MRSSRSVVLLLSAFLVIPPATAQVVNDDVALKNWPVAYETVERMETATRLRHPEVAALPSPASHFISVAPCRIVDTRNAAGPFGGPMFAPEETRTFAIPSSPCIGIPPAAAYSLNFAVVNFSARGNLRAFPSGSALPNVSTLNFGATPGYPVANAAVVPADGAGSIAVYTTQATDVVIDINGYFVMGVVTNLTAGTGMTGGGTGNVTLSLAPGGVTADAIANGTIQAAHIAPGQVVSRLNNLTDSVTIAGAGGATVTTGGNTITVTAPPGGAPAGSLILGFPNDAALLGAGYTELGASGLSLGTPTSTTGAPSARKDHIAVWTGSKMIVWGGLGAAGYQNTGGVYAPGTNTWTATNPAGAPAERSEFTAVWTGTKMIVWGGLNVSGYLNSGGIYDPATDSWTPTNPNGAPSARADHTAVWTGTNMIVWGGAGPSGYENSGSIYDPATATWTPMSAAGAPLPRAYHAAVWNGTKMIVWGGATPTYQNTGGIYDPATGSWTATNTTGAPPPRLGPSAIWTGSRMIVWGGLAGTPVNSGGIYDPVANLWTLTATSTAPTGLNAPAVVWTGTRMIVWGGNGYPSTYEDSGGTLDPLLNSWTPAGATGLSGRYGHTGVWSGSKMIVWGGISAAGYENTGAQLWTALSYYRKN